MIQPYKITIVRDERRLVRPTYHIDIQSIDILLHLDCRWEGKVALSCSELIYQPSPLQLGGNSKDDRNLTLGLEALERFGTHPTRLAHIVDGPQLLINDAIACRDRSVHDLLRIDEIGPVGQSQGAEWRRARSDHGRQDLGIPKQRTGTVLNGRTATRIRRQGERWCRGLAFRRRRL